MIDDEEFVYIEAARRPGTRDTASYDVYRASGTPLGLVVQTETRAWKAIDPDSRDVVRGRSRGAAAAGLWGTR